MSGLSCLFVPSKTLAASGIPLPFFVVEFLIFTIILLIILLIIYLSTDIFDKFSIFSSVMIVIGLIVITFGLCAALSCGISNVSVMAVTTLFISTGVLILLRYTNLLSFKFNWWQNILIVLGSIAVGCFVSLFGKQIGKYLFCDHDCHSIDELNGLKNACSAKINNDEKRIKSLNDQIIKQRELIDKSLMNLTTK